MATNLFDLQASLGLDKKEYTNGLKDAQSQANTAGKSITSKLGSIGANVAKGFAVATAAIGGGIVALGKIGIDYNKEIESYTTSFKTLLGDTASAVAKVDELKTLAAKTPLSLSDLAEGTKTLLAFQVPAEKSTKILTMLGDVALGNSEKMKGLALVFGQVSSAGKLQGQDLLQMINQGFNPLNYIAQRTGESMDELKDRMSKGAISAKEVEQAFEDATSAGGQFANGMETASHTTDGLISTLKDNARALVGEVFKPISDSLLSDVLPSTITAVNDLSEAYKEEGIKGMTAATGEIMGATIAKAVSTLPDFVDLSLKIVNAMVSSLSDNSGSIGTAIFAIVTNALHAVPALLKDSLDLGFSLVSSIVSGLLRAIPDILLAVGKIELALREELLKLPARALALGGDILSALADGMIKSFYLITKTIGDITNFFSGGFDSKKKEFEDIGKNAIIRLINGIFKVIRATQSIGKRIVSWITNDLWEGLKEKASEFKSFGKNLVSSLWSAIKSAFTGDFSGFEKIFSNMGSSITNTFDDIAEVVRTQWNAAGDEVEQKFKELEEVQTATSDNVVATTQEATAAVNESQEQITSKADEESKKTKNKWVSAWSGIKDSVSGAYYSMLAGFSDVGEALVNGESGWKAYGAVALDALSNILSTIGAQMAAMAVWYAVIGQYGKAGLLLAGSAAAYLAAGVVSGLSNNISSGSEDTGTSTSSASSSDSTTVSGASIFESSSQPIYLTVDSKVLASFSLDAVNNGNRRMGVSLT